MLASVALVMALTLPGELVNINLSRPDTFEQVTLRSGQSATSYFVRHPGLLSRVSFRLVEGSGPYGNSHPTLLHVYRVCGSSVDVRDIPFTEVAVTELIEDQMRCRQ